MSPADAQSASLRALPPHLRLLWWPALRGLSGHPALGVSVPASCRDLAPALLAQADGVRVSAAPPMTLHPDRLMALLTSPAAAGGLRPLLDVVCCLAGWDELLRQRGIFAGNAYLASEQAVQRLLELAGVDVGDDIVCYLETLHAMEILYRFPVAYKFRGEFGPERQCRLNCWGRLLFRELGRAGGAGLPLASWREAMSAHLDRHGSGYRTALEEAARASDDAVLPAAGDTWTAVQALPVPLLV